MSDKENEVKPQTEQVTPSPAAPEVVATTPADGAVSAPVESPAAKQDAKITAAFIKQRQENRELKAKLAAAPAVVPSPATPVNTEVAQTVEPKEITPAPAPVTAAPSIEVESANAITEMGKDKDLAAIPGAIIDLLDLVDNDPRLSRLHNIDPVLAFREAKGILMGKYGVSPTPAMPKSSTPSGGMGGGNHNLESLLAMAANEKPGSKRFAELAEQINAESKKLGVW